MTTTDHITPKFVPVALAILCTIAVTFGLYVMRPVLVPFVFSIFLYFILYPLVHALQHKLRFPKFLALFAALVTLCLIISVFLIIFATSLKNLVSGAFVYKRELSKLFDMFSIYLSNYGFDLNLDYVQETILGLPLIDWVTNVSGGIFGFAGNLLLIIFFTYFLLIGDKIDSEKSILNKELRGRITRYLSTKFFTSGLTGIMVFIVLYFFEVKLAVLFGTLTFLLNFIPNVGSIISVLLPLPIAFLQFGFGTKMAIVLLIPGAIQLIVGNIIDPKLMGENLGLDPVVILFALLFWGFIWGVPGMFIAVPTTAIIKLFLEKNKKTKFLSNIMQGDFR